MRSLWIALRLTVMALAVACGEQVPAVVEVGQSAPVYSAETLDGRTISTMSLSGRVVLLNVWATWCAPCREEIPYLQRLHQTREKDGLSIVGVSVDAAGEDARISAFVKEFAMTYPVWRDPNERILTQFMAIGVPASYLIDRRGVLVWKHVGIVRETNTEFTDALEQALGDTTGSD
ncbi:MAG: Thiol-disulfide oxidoreductase ResA [Gemmatimonadaceae bacterium]|nr:Thiol-disulfide oxidoreductase ResA [Gemmatimonadaceae bacterium]